MNEYPVPVRFKGVLPDDLRAVHEANDGEAWMFAREWLDGWPTYVGRGADPERVGSSLVITGTPGTGKTMLASAMLNQIESAHKKSVAFITDDELDSILRKKRFTRMDDEDQYLLNLIQGAGFVAVDDALRLGGTPEIMEPFLRKRFDLGKSTILTINAGIYLSETLASFLSEWTWARFAGPDQRRI